ncbi:hypothetical protein DCM91_14115 [Chitinophaga costaii]|nr:hypothetical protein DCM91_14115 [Chitinophaga costaii]
MLQGKGMMILEVGKQTLSLQVLRKSGKQMPGMFDDIRLQKKHFNGIKTIGKKNIFTGIL